MIECNENQFVCSNGQCISRKSVCDAELDCLDGSDEIHCEGEKNTMK